MAGTFQEASQHDESRSTKIAQESGNQERRVKRKRQPTLDRFSLKEKSKTHPESPHQRAQSHRNAHPRERRTDAFQEASQHDESRKQESGNVSAQERRAERERRKATLEKMSLEEHSENIPKWKRERNVVISHHASDARADQQLQSNLQTGNMNPVTNLQQQLQSPAEMKPNLGAQVNSPLSGPQSAAETGLGNQDAPPGLNQSIPTGLNQGISPPDENQLQQEQEPQQEPEKPWYKKFKFVAPAATAVAGGLAWATGWFSGNDSKNQEGLSTPAKVGLGAGAVAGLAGAGTIAYQCYKRNQKREPVSVSSDSAPKRPKQRDTHKKIPKKSLWIYVVFAIVAVVVLVCVLLFICRTAKPKYQCEWDDEMELP